MSDITFDNSHDWFSQQIATYLADGLAGEELARFRSHAASCFQCAALLEVAEKADANLRGLFEEIEPSAGFEDRLIQGLRQSSRGGRLAWPTLRLPNYPKVYRAAAAVAAVVALGIGGYVATGMMDKGRTGQVVQVGFQTMQTGQRVPSSYSASPAPVRERAKMNAVNMIPQENYKVSSLTAATAAGQTSIAFGFDESRRSESPYQDILSHPTNQFAAASDGRQQTYSGVITPGLQLGNGSAVGSLGTSSYQGAVTINGGTLTLGGANSYSGGSQISAGTLSGRGDIASLVPRQQIANAFVGPQADNTYNQPSAASVDSVRMPTDDNGRSGGDQGGWQAENKSAVATATGENLYYRPAGQRTSGDRVTFDDSESISDGANKTGLASTYSGLIADRGSTVTAGDGDGGGRGGGGGGSFTAKLRPAPTPVSTSDTTPPAQIPPESAPPSEAPAVVAGREIIRHGQMSFEVDSFDSAFMQIRKIAEEEQGFISATSSDKLANGKVSGTVSIRVPPDHLDTLVLKLRGLGDLKGQQIVSDDVTKEYTDLQSELRAAQAMEDRLLDIIKNGKGEVKDLLAAEKELGSWREKVEQVTGQINYYNNLIALSSLDIQLTERDIRQSASATETEHVDMGIESNDVVAARATVLKAIDDHHGRVTVSELKQLEAGELAATIVASVGPDESGPLLDNLRQIGHVARLDMGRQQTTVDGQPVAPGAHLEREDTQFQVSIYNLANIAPRETNNVAMACEDVETAYHTIISRVEAAGGRVVQSGLNRVTAQQIDGSITFETPADQADAVLTDVRGLGEVMNLSVTENPDAANVTASKRGFALTLASFAEIAPRESIAMTILPEGKVADAYAKIQKAAMTDGANITVAQLQQQGSQTTTATLVFNLSRAHQDDIEKALTDAIGATGRQINRHAATSDDLQHTLLSKVQYSLTFASVDALHPRETISITLLPGEDLGAAYHTIQSLAVADGANVMAAQLQEQNSQSAAAVLVFDISDSHQAEIEKALSDAVGNGGRFVQRQSVRSNDLDNTLATKLEYALTFNSADALSPRQTINRALAVSDVAATYNSILAAGQQVNSKVMTAALDQSDPQSPTGRLDLVVPRSGVDSVEAAIDASKAGVISKTVSRSSDLTNTTDEKMDIQLAIVSVDHLPPRLTTTLDVLVADPEQASADLQASVLADGGRVAGQTMEMDSTNQPVAHVQIEIPLKNGSQYIDHVRDLGAVQSIDQTRNPALPDADFTRARLEVTFGQQTGLWLSVKSGLGTSMRGLLYSLELVVIGVCLVLPLAGALWVGTKTIRRLRKKGHQPAAT